MKTTRLLIGILEGYLISSLLTVSLGHSLPFANQAEAVLLTTLISFVIWTCLILYCFTSVTIKNLLIQFSLIALNLFFINQALAQ